MNVGKIPEAVLKRSVLKQIKHRRENVLVGPAVGKDCSVIDITKEELLVLSSDPITGTAKEIGNLAVHITANDIACAGAEVFAVMLTILLPEYTQEAEIKSIISEIEATCNLLNIEIAGGHTEVTKAVNQPVITVTGIGRISKKMFSKLSGAVPGQEIVMTKWAGLEGTTIIATDKEKELLSKYSQGFIDGAKDMKKFLSVIPEARLGSELEVTAMHDVTEGGIFGALWEIGVASKVGMEIDLQKILLKQETVELCEFFNINPYMLISSGCLLMVTDKANQLVKRLEEEGISSSVIGLITEGNDRIIMNNGERRYLEPPKSDELYKVLQ